MQFKVEDKHLIKWLLKIFLTEAEVLLGKRHCSKNQCEVFNFGIFAAVWAVCGRP